MELTVFYRDLLIYSQTNIYRIKLLSRLYEMILSFQEYENIEKNSSQLEGKVPDRSNTLYAISFSSITQEVQVASVSIERDAILSPFSSVEVRSKT